jgi:MFS family permease
MSKKLLNKNFILLLQGQFFSRIGSAAFGVGLIFWLKQETNSATLIGLLSMASMIPGVLLQPFGGTIADFYSRKSIIVYGDAVNGFIVVAIALVMLFYQSHTDVLVVLFFLGAIVSGVVAAFFLPAVSASIPDLVPQNKIEAANSLIQFSTQVSAIGGQLVGGILFRVAGATILAFIDGITHLASAFSESFISIPQNIDSGSEVWRNKMAVLKKETVAGFVYVLGTRGLKELFLVLAVGNFFLAPSVILLPFFVEDTLDSTSDWYGIILAGEMVGMALGSFLSGVIKIRPNFRGKIVTLLIMSEGVMFCLCGYSNNVITVLVLFWVFGICSGAANVLLISALQRIIPSNMRGRIFGLLGTMSSGMMPLSLGVAGVITDLMDRNIPLIYIGCGIIVIFVNLVLFLNSGFHRFMSGETSGSTR